MASLQSIGRPPTGGRGVQNVFQANEQLNSATTSRDGVDGRVIELAGAKATKQYVDDRDATGPDGTAYTNPGYVAQQDALYLPNTAKGIPNGVAVMNATGRIPVEICPVLGSGYVKGPWGHVNAYAATSNSGYKAKIADWGVYPGITAYKCHILAWASVFVGTRNQSRPVVEIRLGGVNDTTYASQTLIARGVGTLYYDDTQVITVQPCADNDTYTAARVPATASGGTPWYIDSNFSTRLTMWMYDESTTGTSTVALPEHVAASSAWVMKVLT